MNTIDRLRAELIAEQSKNVEQGARIMFLTKEVQRLTEDVAQWERVGEKMDAALKYTEERLSRAIVALKDAVNEDWAKAEEALKELEGQ